MCWCAAWPQYPNGKQCFIAVAGLLQQRIEALEQERAEFLKLKQQLEMEFNQKRAKFKELYLSKEGECVCKWIGVF